MAFKNVSLLKFIMLVAVVSCTSEMSLDEELTAILSTDSEDKYIHGFQSLSVSGSAGDCSFCGLELARFGGPGGRIYDAICGCLMKNLIPGAASAEKYCKAMIEAVGGFSGGTAGDMFNGLTTFITAVNYGPPTIAKVAGLCLAKGECNSAYCDANDKSCADCCSSEMLKSYSKKIPMLSCLVSIGESIFGILISIAENFQERRTFSPENAMTYSDCRALDSFEFLPSGLLSPTRRSECTASTVNNCCSTYCRGYRLNSSGIPSTLSACDVNTCVCEACAACCDWASRKCYNNRLDGGNENPDQNFREACWANALTLSPFEESMVNAHQMDQYSQMCVDAEIDPNLWGNSGPYNCKDFPMTSSAVGTLEGNCGSGGDTTEEEPEYPEGPEFTYEEETEYPEGPEFTYEGGDEELNGGGGVEEINGGGSVVNYGGGGNSGTNHGGGGNSGTNYGGGVAGHGESNEGGTGATGAGIDGGTSGGSERLSTTCNGSGLCKGIWWSCNPGFACTTNFSQYAEKGLTCWQVLKLPENPGCTCMSTRSFACRSVSLEIGTTLGSSLYQ